MSNIKKIKILPNGPYLIDEDLELNSSFLEDDGEGGTTAFSNGKKYETAGKYSLCRCGHSKNKPFCDGTHAKINFDGEETSDNIPYLESSKIYVGKAFSIRDKQELCVVARFCDRLEGAWRLTMKSGTGNEEKDNMAIFMGESCPSGRLTIEKDGKLLEPEYKKSIDLLNDKYNNCKGPIFAKGGIIIEGSSGTIYEIRNRMTLCRCGESKNKPFCDAAHLNAEHMKGFDK
ncbi:MAG: CDGSH iron-sulfur domain-containing protein [Clostridiales Family XIII bacterium]|jgi:CDGSH-type Zn-finger protein|nr:CDGSH iron-sulfur domain-containing protein [Clostridiales Family XIII bacterium]